MNSPKEHFDLLEDNRPLQDPEMEELDNLEENISLYTWISIMFGIIWLLSIFVI